MPGVVTLQSLSKSYGPNRALSAVDLEIEEGEIFGYLGPNGAGKTTTIRILMGFLRPSAGTARIFGDDAWNDVVRIHARTGYVPGDLRLYDRLTGQETVDYFADLRVRGEVGRRGTLQGDAQRLAGRLELDLTQRVGAMSRGTKQKLAIVQAIMARPDLLLLDEPTSGLDPLIQKEFHTLLREMTDRGGTVFLSSHVLGEVQQIADRVGIIRGGHLVATDRLETLRGQAIHKVDVRFSEPVRAEIFCRLPGIQDISVQGPVLRCGIPESSIDALIKALAAFHVVDVAISEADLEEMFLAFYGKAQADAA